LLTGKLLGTLVGAHRGSVLCLKFEKDWDRDWEYDDSIGEEEGSRDTYHHLSSGVNASQLDDPRFKGSSSNQEGPRSWTNRNATRKGFMVSGSSDCSVCVWDLHLGATIDQDDSVSMEDIQPERSIDEGDREVTGEVRQILKGHAGGVLDLRIDKQWIVSWYVFSSLSSSGASFSYYDTALRTP
jgi:F-box and WD-40 domain protein 1/11